MQQYVEEKYQLPPVIENDFGIDWPLSPSGASTDQITKELAGFAANGKKAKFESRHRHGLRLIQMLWPQKDSSDTQVRLYRVVKHHKTGDSEIVWNNYFMDAFKALCENDRVSLTGCASSGKTFAVAVYSILMFMSDPLNTTIMVSTTAGTDAERRIWGEIKELHSALAEVYPLGTLVEYLKCITFDPNKELDESGGLDFKRDLGSGIIVIPIPKGGEGDKALGKVIGTKNKKIIWVIDEMPHMMDGVLRPESNLEFNEYYQLIVIGNANRKTDPHGKVSEPTGGWETVSVNSKTWWAKDCFVLFLHGERSPNFHPAIDPEEKDKSALPFPYLSNRIAIRNVAIRNGYGSTIEEQITTGMLTIDYMRFAVGFWYGDEIEATILSDSYVKEHKAHIDDVSWNYKPRITVAGFDPSFTSGGDKNVISFGEVGYDYTGSQILKVDKETFPVRTLADTNDSFRKAVSKIVVDQCVRRGVEPEDFFMDISGDGGLMALEINKCWGERINRVCKINGISSTEKTGDEDDRYHDIVTKLWFQTQRAVATERVRGFNTRSAYAKDLFERRYESVGKGVVRIESKGNVKTMGGSGFKSRMGRSPDDGDSFVYMVEGAKRRGFSLSHDPGKARSKRKRADINALLSRMGKPEAAEPFSGISHEEAATSEPESWAYESSLN